MPDITTTMQNRHDLQGLGLWPIDDEVGINRKKLHRFIGQIMPPVSNAGHPGEDFNFLKDARLNLIGNHKASLQRQILPKTPDVVFGVR